MSFVDLLLISRAAFNAVLLLSGATLIGFALLPRRWRSFDPVVALLQSLSLGITLSTVAFWTVGVLAGTAVIPWLAAVLLSGATFRVRAWWRLLRLAFRRVGASLRGCRMAVFLFSIPLLFSLPSLLLPVVDSDGLRYHLALPKLFLLTGKIFLYPWDIAGAYPKSAEMLYLLGLQMGPPETAKWLHFLIVLLGVASLVYFVGGARSGLASGWSFLLVPVVLSGASVAFIDGFAVYHIAVALLLFRRRASSWAVGLALAGALWTKWTVFPALAGLFLLSLILFRRRGLLKSVVAVTLPAVLLIAPLAIRNLVLLSDPFSPVLTSALGREVPGLNQELQAGIAHRHANVPGLLGIPWGRGVGVVEADEVIGWHLLPALFLWPLFWRDPRVRLVSAVMLPYLIAGFWIQPSMRLVLPLVWGLAVVFGLVFGWVEGRVGARGGRWLFLLLVFLTMPLLTMHRAGELRDFVPYLRGELSRRQVIERRVPGAKAAEWINHQAVPGKVMALDFPAPFLFDRPWLAEGLYNRPPLALWLDEGADAAGLREKLREQNVRFILVTPGYGGGRFQSLLPLASNGEQKKILVEFRSGLRLRYRREGVDIWEVEEGDFPRF